MLKKVINRYVVIVTTRAGSRLTYSTDDKIVKTPEQVLEGLETSVIPMLKELIAAREENR